MWDEVWGWTLSNADASLQMIFSVRLLYVGHSFTSDIIEKCLLSTFMQVVLSVGETQLGKNL